jgi:hypothetical protein
VFVDHSDGDRRFVGIDPDQDLHERRHLRFGRISLPVACAEDIPTSGPAAIPLLSHSARRTPAGRKPRTGQPISHGRQEVGERSL